MAEHPIQGLMNVTMEKIHQMVDSNTIIGKPITTEDGITILPVSKVSFGFASHVVKRTPSFGLEVSIHTLLLSITTLNTAEP